MKRRAVSFLLAVLILGLASFTPQTAQAYVTVNSNVTTNTIWTTGNTYYVATSISVVSVVTLTIEEGVFVKFAPGVVFSIYGTLNASAGTLIRFFTSRNDNNVGEIITGSTGYPAPDDWSGIRFYNGSSGSLGYCTIEFANTGINGFSAFPNLSNCTIQNNNTGMYVSNFSLVLSTPNTIQNNISAGINVYNCTNPSISNQMLTGNTGAYGAIYMQDTGEFTLGSGNTITGNSWPLTVNPGSFPHPNSIIPSTGNSNNAIQVRGIGGAKSGTWFNLGMEYIVTSNASIGSGGSLTIPEGMIIKFDSNVVFYIYGNLIAIGSVNNQIIFTHRDSSEVWGGLTYGSQLSNNLSYCTIENASTGIYSSPSYLNISNCIIQNNTTGINMNIGNSAAIENIIVRNNQTGILFSNGFPSLSNCVIENNSIGLYVSNYSVILFSQNIIRNNTLVGIKFSNCTSTVISNQMLTGNTGLYGAIFLSNTVEFTIGSGNTITGNSWPVTIDPGSSLHISSIIPVSGNINNAIQVREFGGAFQSVIWSNFSPVDYVLTGQATLYTGSSLTISAGVVVRFGTQGRLWVKGTLNAIGDVANPILFTRRDSSVTWQGIHFDNISSSGIFSYCTIEYSNFGIWSNSASLEFYNCTIENNYRGIQTVYIPPKIDSCIIQNNYEGIYVSNILSDSLYINNSLIRGNQKGIFVSGGYFNISNCVVENNNTGLYNGGGTPILSSPNIIRNNTVVGIHLRYCDNPSISNQILVNNTGSYGAIFMQDTEEFTIGEGNTIIGNSWPLSIDLNSFPSDSSTFPDSGNINNAIQILGGVSFGLIALKDYGIDYIVTGIIHANIMTISPGTTIRFDNGMFVLINGSLQAIGTSTAPIIFTRRNSSGYWSGINFPGGGLGTMDHCIVEYAWTGINATAAVLNISNSKISNNETNGILVSDASSPMISDCIISNNGQRGVYCTNGSTPDITWSRIVNNGYGITSQNAQPTLHFNHLYDNTQFDYQNLGPQNIDADQNYWGPATTAEMDSKPYPSNIAAIYDSFDNNTYGMVEYADWLHDEPAILQISPNNVTNSGIVEVTVRGNGFQPGAEVKFSRAGYQDILTSNTSFVDSSKIIGIFDFTGRQLGSWDVVATDSGGQNLILQNGLIIGEGFVNLQVEYFTRHLLRVGREATALVQITNDGNIDTPPIVVEIGVWNEGTPRIKAMLDESSTEVIEGAIYSGITIIPQLPAGMYTRIPVSLTLPNTNCFQIQAVPEILPIQSSDPCEQILSAIQYFRAKVDWAQQNLDTCDFDPECEEKWQGLLDHYQIILNKSCNKWLEECNSIPPPECLGAVYNEVNIKFIENIKNSNLNQMNYLRTLTNNSSSAMVCGVISLDPNEKTGPYGIGSSGYISPALNYSYAVYFENIDSATAAAQEIEILDTLDSDLDWSTFSFSDLQIADTLISISNGGTVFNRIIPWNDTVEVHIDGAFDANTGVIRWYMRGTDIRNGDLADFLPPNVNPPEGEGWVSFSVNPKSDLQTGDQITNRAAIIFDVNPQMLTNEVLNTIDAQAPTSGVIAVSDTAAGAAFEVTWAGQDDPGGSQIRHYSIYAAEDGGAFVPWLNQASQTVDVYPGFSNHTYWFYSIARDSVGNLEHQPNVPDLIVWNTGYEFSNAGWQLVSIANHPPNDSVATLFPGALAAYGWNPSPQHYVPAASFDTTAGYWLAISPADSFYLAAPPMNEYTRHFQPGWHLIGSVAQVVDFSDPNDNPDSSVIAAFGWNPETKSYFPTDTLLPNQGYWIAVLQECDLTVGEDIPLAKGRGEVGNIAELKKSFYQTYGATPPPPPPFPEVEDAISRVPQVYELFQNYPNPFNPSTTIKYALPKPGHTKLVIYNVLGQRVATLVDEKQAAGYYQVVWDGKAQGGYRVASGMYFYRLVAGDYHKVKKMLLIR